MSQPRAATARAVASDGPGVDAVERVEEGGAGQERQGREGEDGGGHLGRLGDGRQRAVPERVAAGEEGGALDDGEGGGQRHRHGGGRAGRRRGRSTGRRPPPTPRPGRRGRGPGSRRAWRARTTAASTAAAADAAGVVKPSSARVPVPRGARREAAATSTGASPADGGPDGRRPAGVPRPGDEEMGGSHISQQGGSGQRHRGRHRRDGGDAGGQDHDAGRSRPEEHDRAGGQAEPAQRDDAGDPLGHEQLAPLQAGVGADPGHVDRHQEGAEVEEHVARWRAGSVAAGGRRPGRRR